jgi:hypothetical protein
MRMPDGSVPPSKQTQGLLRGLREWERSFHTLFWSDADEHAAARSVQALSQWLVDAVMQQDVMALHTALNLLRPICVSLDRQPADARLAGSLSALLATARAGLDRSRQAADVRSLDLSSLMGRALTALVDQPGMIMAVLAQRLAVTTTELEPRLQTLVERGFLTFPPAPVPIRRFYASPLGVHAVETQRAA